METENVTTSAATTTAAKGKVKAPKGVGKFDEMVVVKGTAKHPTLPEKEYKVHSSQVAYLESKGYIVKK